MLDMKTRVRTLFVEHFGQEEMAAIRDDTPIGGREDPIDSLDKIEAMMAIEDSFAIIIPDRDAENINSIDEMASYLVARGIKATA